MNVLAAKLFGTHGLKGALKALSLIELKAPIEGELRFKNGAVRKVKLIETGGRTLRFEGFDAPETARALGNSEFWIERAQAPALPPGSHYLADLLGKRVVDEKRGDLGSVLGLVETGGNPCLEIQPDKGESWLIPLTDEVVISVGDTVQVKLLPGLHPDETEEA